jgi:hypothetical protein
LSSFEYQLHEIRGNRSEGAEIRWRIFIICAQAECTWSQQWVPRQPLDWTKRGYEDMDAYSSGRYATSSSSSSSSSSSAIWIEGFPIKHIAGNRSFLAVLGRAIVAPPARAWQSYQQLSMHMETSLTVAAQRFTAVSLIHMAERASFRLLRLYREAGKLDKMATEYARAAAAFRSMSDMSNPSNSNFALGTFYSVLYIGQGKKKRLTFCFSVVSHNL